MISTPSRASCFATMIFSSTFMLAPGDCSPSRNVVSKILNHACHGFTSLQFRAAQNGRPARPQAQETPQAYPLGYVEDVFKPRTKLAAFSAVCKNTKASIPTAQGRRLDEAPWYHPDSAMNNVSLSTALHYALSRGQGGIHYSGFTDSGSEASSAPHRLVCTIHQLSHCCANRVLLLVVAIIRTSIQSPTARSLGDGRFPAILDRSPTSRSAGPSKA